MFKIPVLKIRDKLTGEEHIIGSNTHDRLELAPDGTLHYYNMQNGDGCTPGLESGYEFVTQWDGEADIIPRYSLEELSDMVRIAEAENEQIKM